MTWDRETHMACDRWRLCRPDGDYMVTLKRIQGKYVFAGLNPKNVVFTQAKTPASAMALVDQILADKGAIK